MEGRLLGQPLKAGSLSGWGRDQKCEKVSKCHCWLKTEGHAQEHMGLLSVEAALAEGLQGHGISGQSCVKLSLPQNLNELGIKFFPCPVHRVRALNDQCFDFYLTKPESRTQPPLPVAHKTLR